VLTVPQLRGSVSMPLTLSARSSKTFAQKGASGRLGCKDWVGFWRFNGTQDVGRWPFAEWNVW